MHLKHEKHFSADLTANVSHCNAQGMLFYLHRKDLITQNTKLLYSFDFLHHKNCSELKNKQIQHETNNSAVRPHVILDFIDFGWP